MREGLGDLPGVSLLPMATERGDREDNCWLTSIVLDPARVTMSAAALIKELDASDIEARYLWKPMHLQPVFRESRSFINGASEWLFLNGVTLPSGSRLNGRRHSTSDQCDAICVEILMLMVVSYRGKRTLDLLVSVPALLLTLPVQAIVGCLVAAKLGRPVLFRQLRPGLHGRPFELVKFRTMLPQDPARGLVDDSSRMTGLGQFLRAAASMNCPL